MRYLLALLMLAGCVTYDPPVPAIGGPTPPVALAVAYTQTRGVKPTINDLDALTDRFRKLVFVSELGDQFPYVSKWRGHVPVYVNGSDAVFDEVLTYSWELRGLTGLSIAPQRTDTLPSVSTPHIYIEEGKRHPTDYGFRPCYGGMRIHPPTGEIVRSVIGVNKHSLITTRRCIREELAQALGPRNDDQGWPDSIFNDLNTTDESLSWADAVILRALYDQRLLIGTHRDQAMPIVRQVLSEILTEINAPTATAAR